jgi:hypothetical protein
VPQPETPLTRTFRPQRRLSRRSPRSLHDRPADRHGCPSPKVRVRSRSIDSRMCPAGLVQTKGSGSSFHWPRGGRRVRGWTQVRLPPRMSSSVVKPDRGSTWLTQLELVACWASAGAWSAKSWPSTSWGAVVVTDQVHVQSRLSSRASCGHRGRQVQPRPARPGPVDGPLRASPTSSMFSLSGALE